MELVWAIARRDIVAAFTTPLAWLVIAAWSLVTNVVFAMTLSSVAQAMQLGSPGSDQPLFVNTLTTGVFFLALLAPAVTMTSFAAERTQGTMQLLLTVPITELQLVAGKFLAAFAVLAALVLATLVQPAVLLFISDVAGPQLAVGYLGLALVCAFLAALGVWISLLVDSPVAAYVITFAAIMVLVLIGVGDEPGPLRAIAERVGLTLRSRAFFLGELRLGDCAYFLGGAVAFLALSHAALSARRIHG